MQFQTTIIPHLFGKPGSGAYWGGWDWKKSIANGMTRAGLDFSGEFDWVETTYVFPITHMVAPKEDSLSCTECHSRTDSRLAELTGFYMPARDGSKIIEIIGWAVVLASLVGVLIHALGRAFTNGRKEK